MIQGNGDLHRISPFIRIKHITPQEELLQLHHFSSYFQWVASPMVFPTFPIVSLVREERRPRISLPERGAVSIPAVKPTAIPATAPMIIFPLELSGFLFQFK
jgi:hypothetical protein